MINNEIPIDPDSENKIKVDFTDLNKQLDQLLKDRTEACFVPDPYSETGLSPSSDWMNQPVNIPQVEWPQTPPTDNNKTFVDWVKGYIIGVGQSEVRLDEIQEKLKELGI